MPGVSTLIDAQQSWTTPLGFISRNNFLGVRLSATTTSSRAQLVGNGISLILTNPGTVEAYVTCGGASVVATTAHFPVLAGQQTTLSIPNDGSVTFVAAITASGSTPIIAHIGYGV